MDNVKYILKKSRIEASVIVDVVFIGPLLNRIIKFLAPASNPISFVQIFKLNNNQKKKKKERKINE